MPLDPSRAKGRKKKSVKATETWLKHPPSKLVGWSINQSLAWKSVYTMSGLFKKQAGQVAFWIFVRQTGCDQPNWGPAG